MALITEEIAAQLRAEFKELKNDVRLAVFSQALAEPVSEEVRRMAVELGELDPRIKVEEYNFVLDQEKAESLGIRRIPAIAVMGAEKDYGIRLYGLPTGYEFGLLVDAIVDVSRGESQLSEETKAALLALEKPAHVQVFSTPTCPYCPRAARLAFRFALESDKVTADSVEVTGFPELARQYRVSSVPKTVVSDVAEFVGAGPEAMLLAAVQDAAKDGGGLIV
jgi:glutaredoxin-like protein